MLQPRAIPANICIHLTFPESSHCLHCCRWQYGSIFVQICAVGSKRRIFSAPECVLVVQGHSRSSEVDDFGTNRKRVCDFLLVVHCNYGPTLYRFSDTATYWLKITHFPTLTPVLFGARAPYVLFGISISR